VLLSDVLAASIAWQPDDADVVLLAAVEADLPVVETVLATLGAKTRGQIFVEVQHESAIRPLAAPGRCCVTWLVRDRGQSLRGAVDAWLAEMLPVSLDHEHRVYAWMSGAGRARHVTNA
jgi:NADPH-dependent ferric siderophore reductase